MLKQDHMALLLLLCNLEQVTYIPNALISIVEIKNLDDRVWGNIK